MFRTLILNVLLVYFVLPLNCQTNNNGVRQIDFKLHQFYKHRTSQFYGDYSAKSDVIIRRGADFEFEVLLNEAQSDVNIEVYLSFETKMDRIDVRLPSQAHSGWSLNQSPSRRGIHAVIHIPGTAAVGVWKMAVSVKSSSGSDIDQYDAPNRIIVLFNAWSQEDAAYFPEQHKLSEYVLNENGISYYFNWVRWGGRPWNYGQFQPQVLDALLLVLSQSPLYASERGDIVRVTRTLTHMLNDGGLQFPGVLRGRWKEPFDAPLDGRSTTKPTSWTGSASIYREYLSNGGKTVGYGQCWVYAGILVTALRGLGIASRQVTNFVSAHDEGNDLAVDTYLDENGFEKQRGDTLWNFHVWCQGYFRRDDLPSGSGWQELDATPQAIHEGNLQVGPASNNLIRSTQLRSPFETGYLYSEVNADEVVWSLKGEISEIRRDKVGLALVTKAYGSDAADDIARTYKPPENTPEERESYKAAAAAMGISPVSLRSEYIRERAAKHTIVLKIKVSKNLQIGAPIDAQIIIRNPLSRIKIVNLGIRASSIYYTGKIAEIIKKQMKKLTLKAGETKNVKFTIQPIDYAYKLKAFGTIYLEVAAITEKTMSRAEKKFSLDAPSLSINAPKTVAVNQTFHANLQFRNPFNFPLKNCYIVVEGNRLERRIFPMSDIPPLSVGKTTMNLHTTYPFRERIIVSFHSAYLKEVIGVFYVQVTGTQKHSFSYYTKTPNYQQSHHITHHQSSMVGGMKDTSVNVNVATTSTSNMYHCCNIIYF